MSSAVPPNISRGTPFERGSPTESYPIEGSKTTPFFPAVCLTSHWDPTKIYERTVPVALVSLPLDFRPYTKVCLEYRTSAPETKAPEVPNDLVFPSGGENYPPTRYLNNIDNESLLRRLDRPLGTCDPKQYVPNNSGDMFVDRMLVPSSKGASSRFVEELSMPQALIRAGPYGCRANADQDNWDKSTKLFNNATKQDRYVKHIPGLSDSSYKNQNIWNDKNSRCGSLNSRQSAELRHNVPLKRSTLGSNTVSRQPMVREDYGSYTPVGVMKVRGPSNPQVAAWRQSPVCNEKGVCKVQPNPIVVSGSSF